MSDPEITNTDPYPQLVLTVSSQYPSITVTNPPAILLGSGGGGAQGDPGPKGSTGERGATGATGFGYTGAYISGFTLYMQPVVDGVPQSAVPIGTISAEGPGETVWDDTTPTNTTVGGLASGTNLYGLKAIEILKEILYAYESVSFTSFSVNLVGGTSNREVGQTISAAPSGRTISWTTSGPNENWTANSLYVSVNDGVDPVYNLIDNLNYSDSGTSVAHPAYVYNIPTNLVFTLQGAQAEGSNPSITETYSWKYKVYYGSSASSSISDFTGFSSEFATSSPTTTRSFVGDSVTTKYFYFVIPDYAGFSNYVSFTNTSNNSSVSFLSAVSINVTNAYGISIPYKYFRSAIGSAGSINIRPNLT